MPAGEVAVADNQCSNPSPPGLPQVCLSLVPRIGGAEWREDRCHFVVLPFRCSFQHGLHGIPDGQVGARTWWKGYGFTEFKDVNWFSVELILPEVILELIST